MVSDIFFIRQSSVQSEMLEQLEHTVGIIMLHKECRVPTRTVFHPENLQSRLRIREHNLGEAATFEKARVHNSQRVRIPTSE